MFTLQRTRILLRVFLAFANGGDPLGYDLMQGAFVKMIRKSVGVLLTNGYGLLDRELCLRKLRRIMLVVGMVGQIGLLGLARRGYKQ